MEDLYDQVNQRFDRVQQVIKGNITNERFRVLKEEEKQRCQKQNFIISMMRANKSVQIISKKYSLEIMKKINPEFKHQMNLQRLQENFLNDFVGLYRHFFFKYEEIFNFKLKIQNLIRPTNHNLIIDLVKYLVDFSRDYYQQTFFWYIKSTSAKIQKIQQEVKDLDETLQLDRQQRISSKKNGRTSFNDAILQKLISKKIDQNQSVLKKDSSKIYQILDIVPLPAIASQTKDPISTNIEVLKMRVNQIYRDMKSRNVTTKANTQNYLIRYNSDKGEYKMKQYQQSQDESMNRAIHPFRMTLIIEKNGFNYINVLISQNRYYSKQKDKKLSPLKVSQRIVPLIDNKPKAQYLLTSLKIIRISENFLPPILNSQISIANTTVNLPFLENNSRINLLSSNSAANQQQLSKKNKKQSFHHGTQSNLSTNQQKMFKQKSYRKLSEIKKNFKSQQKRQGGILPIANTVLNRDDPQKKIYDWLQKLRQIKEIERKKIMGLG